MKKQRTSFKYCLVLPAISMLSLLLLSSACEKEPVRQLPWWESLRSSPPGLGAYEVIDMYQGQERTYEMVIRQTGDSDQDLVEICNFAGRRIDVKAHISREGQIGMEAQRFSTELGDFDLFQGMGTITEEGLNIIFWARENEENFKQELVAVRKGYGG